MHAFNKDSAVSPRGQRQLFCQLRILGKRLFAEHMFARFDRPTRPIVVKRWRKRDVYCVDISRF